MKKIIYYAAIALIGTACSSELSPEEIRESYIEKANAFLTSQFNDPTNEFAFEFKGLENLAIDTIEILNSREKLLLQNAIFIDSMEFEVKMYKLSAEMDAIIGKGVSQKTLMHQEKAQKMMDRREKLVEKLEKTPDNDTANITVKFTCDFIKKDGSVFRDKIVPIQFTKDHQLDGDMNK